MVDFQGRGLQYIAFGLLLSALGSTVAQAKAVAAKKLNHTVCVSAMVDRQVTALAATTMQESKERRPAADKRSPDTCAKDAERVTDLTLDFAKIPSECKDLKVVDVKKKQRRALRQMASLPSGQVVLPEKKETLAKYTARLMKARYWENCVKK